MIMYKINFQKPVHVHFIGIGGISMSGLAEILLDECFTISGSDNKESSLTRHLEGLGAKVFIGQRSSNIEDDVQVVVYTAAIHKDNEEYQEAVRRNLPMLSRAELLGQLMTNYETPIAVAGTHGKTTTTSMLSHILLAGEKDPTISVGGILKAIHGNIRVGSSEIFVTEACEYTNSYHHFFPKISLILNVEEDHMDFFKDIDDIRKSFHTFAKLLPPDGTLIINGEISHLNEILTDLNCHVLIYDLHNADADFSAADIRHDDKGNVSFELLVKGRKAGHIRLSVNGLHNVSNALPLLPHRFWTSRWKRSRRGCFPLRAQTADSSTKEMSTDSISWTIMPTIQRRSVPRWKPQSLTRIRRPGVSSSLTLTVERRHSSTSL